MSVKSGKTKHVSKLSELRFPVFSSMIVLGNLFNYSI